MIRHKCLHKVINQFISILTVFAAHAHAERSVELCSTTIIVCYSNDYTVELKSLDSDQNAGSLSFLKFQTFSKDTCLHVFSSQIVVQIRVSHEIWMSSKLILYCWFIHYTDMSKSLKA